MRNGAFAFRRRAMSLALSRGDRDCPLRIGFFPRPGLGGLWITNARHCRPSQVQRLVIFADNDYSAGRCAANRAAIAHSFEWRETIVINPRQPFKDFNDVVQAYRIGGLRK